MQCPHAPEIKAQLLSPLHRARLQKFIRRWTLDPHFLVYHRESTTLYLRQELGCSFRHTASHSRRDHVRLGDCRMADTLKAAMEERIIEQELQNL